MRRRYVARQNLVDAGGLRSWRRPGRRTAVIVVTVAAGVVAATALAAVQAFPQGKPLKIIYVSQLPASDPFGSIIVNGFNAACKQYRVSCTYRGLSAVAFNAADMIKLLQNAKAANPDGLIASDSAPSGLNKTLKSISSSGTPLILANTGYGQTAATGALTFVGNQEYNLGFAGGSKLRALGLKHAILFTTQPGIPLADQRNAGFKAAFKGAVDAVQVAATDLNNSTKMANILKASMLKDQKADAVFSIGSALNPAMLAVRGGLGSRADQIHWSSIDLTPLVVKALKAKQMDFAIVQQQYLEGYLAVQQMVFYLRGGFTPAREFTPAGPTYVTPDNVARFVQYTAQGLE
jgi:simple sugar transport system substrate-binding protein